MQIEIKKLKLGIIGREGVRTYTADIYLDGKKVADCREDGNGGNLSIYPIDGASWNSPTIKKMDDWCKKNLPKWKAFDGDMVETDLEMHICSLVGDIETQKALVRDMKKSLCYETKESKAKPVAYNRMGWKNFNIEQMLKASNGPAMLRAAILEIQIKGGKILNTNLGSLQELVK